MQALEVLSHLVISHAAKAMTDLCDDLAQTSAEEKVCCESRLRKGSSFRLRVCEEMAEIDITRCPSSQRPASITRAHKVSEKSASIDVGLPRRHEYLLP